MAKAVIPTTKASPKVNGSKNNLRTKGKQAPAETSLNMRHMKPALTTMTIQATKNKKRSMAKLIPPSDRQKKKWSLS